MSLLVSYHFPLLPIQISLSLSLSSYIYIIYFPSLLSISSHSYPFPLIYPSFMVSPFPQYPSILLLLPFPSVAYFINFPFLIIMLSPDIFSPSLPLTLTTFSSLSLSTLLSPHILFFFPFILHSYHSYPSYRLYFPSHSLLSLSFCPLLSPLFPLTFHSKSLSLILSFYILYFFPLLLSQFPLKFFLHYISIVTRIIPHS